MTTEENDEIKRLIDGLPIDHGRRTIYIQEKNLLYTARQAFAMERIATALESHITLNASLMEWMGRYLPPAPEEIDDDIKHIDVEDDNDA